MCFPLTDVLEAETAKQVFLQLIRQEQEQKQNSSTACWLSAVWTRSDRHVVLELGLPHPASACDCGDSVFRPHMCMSRTSTAFVRWRRAGELVQC